MGDQIIWEEISPSPGIKVVDSAYCEEEADNTSGKIPVVAGEGVVHAGVDGGGLMVMVTALLLPAHVHAFHLGSAPAAGPLWPSDFYQKQQKEACGRSWRSVG